MIEKQVEFQKPQDAEEPREKCLSFDEVLDDTCRHLEDAQVRYSLRRLEEMEQNLDQLELELEDFILAGSV